jgi:predicted DNA-binding transcriptional regulator YafY
MSRESGLHRLFALERLLRERPRTRRQLEHHFPGVSRRQLQTDLRTLREVCGLKEHPTDAWTYFIPDRAHTRGLTPLEVLAAHAGVRLLYHHAPNKTYRSVLDTLGRRLPTHLQGIVKRSTADLETRLHESQKSRKAQHHDRALEKAVSAWVQGRTLEFHYVKPGGSGIKRPNILEIYLLEIHRVNLGVYAIGRVTNFGDDKRIRTFKVSRMIQPELGSETYDIPEKFDPSAYLQDAWGIVGQSDGKTITVRLRFKPEALARLEEGGYPNMTIKSKTKGHALVTIRTGVDGSGLPRELLAWIHTWGPRVSVLSPQDLRERWLEDAREIVRDNA